MRENNGRVPSAPGSSPSGEAPAGLPAFGASIPRAQWQPLETVPDSGTVFLLCDGSLHDAKTGKLIPAYFLWAAHRWKEPRQRKARWCCFDDVEKAFDPASMCALAWAPFPEHGIPEGETFQFASAIEAHRDETEGLGPKAESAVGNAETSEQRADACVPHFESNYAEHVMRVGIVRRVADALAAAERAAYERAASKAYGNMGDIKSPTAYSQGRRDARESILSLIDKPKEPT